LTWTKLDDGFWSNPKVVRVGNEAAGVYTRLLSYCGQHETDGHVPDEVARFVGRPRVLNALVEVGLMERNGVGYLIPDYLDFNPSRADQEDKRRKDRERKAAERAGNP
jgi:hypothetical protein